MHPAEAKVDHWPAARGVYYASSLRRGHCRQLNLIHHKRLDQLCRWRRSNDFENRLVCKSNRPFGDGIYVSSDPESPQACQKCVRAYAERLQVLNRIRRKADGLQIVQDMFEA